MSAGTESPPSAEPARAIDIDAMDSQADDNLEEALEDSFPASDPPAANRFD